MYALSNDEIVWDKTETGTGMLHVCVRASVYEWHQFGSSHPGGVNDFCQLYVVNIDKIYFFSGHYFTCCHVHIASTYLDSNIL